MEDQFDSALLTDIGVKRKQNQDFGIARPDLGLFIVADGMGGHQGGEIASQMCAEKVVEYVEKNQGSPEPDDTVVHQGLVIANQAIFDLSRREPHLQGMGTTSSILRINGNLATLVQVGDSRIYYWNRSGVWQLTRDHSLVQEKLRAGLITREQLKTDQMKNVITRSVGYEPNLKADIFHFEVQSGDGFLLCSDGLSGPVEDPAMFEILEETATSGLSLKDAARMLVNEANNRGGDDNVTVLLLKVK